ncbi:MAG: hypothetical protein K6D02_01800 [Lachnospiraceae bacterium]|nr:hypothetical protein [Lachnospiraceae bacterium]
MKKILLLLLILLFPASAKAEVYTNPKSEQIPVRTQVGGLCWADTLCDHIALNQTQPFSSFVSELDIVYAIWKNYYPEYSFNEMINNGVSDTNVIYEFVKNNPQILKKEYMNITDYDKVTTLSAITPKYELVNNIVYSVDYEVQDINLHYVTPTPSAIKSAIKEYGSVLTSIYIYEGGKYFTAKDGYTTYYFNHPVVNPNHAITIVGFDDDYPKENFSKTPSKNGAWLVKGTWGTNYVNNITSDTLCNGYYWISYDEKEIYTQEPVFFTLSLTQTKIADITNPSNLITKQYPLLTSVSKIDESLPWDITENSDTNTPTDTPTDTSVSPQPDDTQGEITDIPTDTSVSPQPDDSQGEITDTPDTNEEDVSTPSKTQKIKIKVVKKSKYIRFSLNKRKKVIIIFQKNNKTKRFNFKKKLKIKRKYLKYKFRIKIGTKVKKYKTLKKFFGNRKKLFLVLTYTN